MGFIGFSILRSDSMGIYREFELKKLINELIRKEKFTISYLSNDMGTLETDDGIEINIKLEDNWINLYFYKEIKVKDIRILIKANDKISLREVNIFEKVKKRINGILDVIRNL